MEVMDKYNYKNCQSLFGYAADVHVRSQGKCQLCGCGGDPLSFDLWRQMTVEHLIGRSQGGYLKQIREIVNERFSYLSKEQREEISRTIDTFNTVTACSFCNSTTSRNINSKTMEQLLNDVQGNARAVLAHIEIELKTVLEAKRKEVKWKLESIKEAFENNILNTIDNAKANKALQRTSC